LYKEEPHYGMLPDLNTTANSEVRDFLAERQTASDMLKYQLEKAQLRMKHYADKNRTLREFQVGDSVFLKLQPYVQQSVVQRNFPKLSYKFYGPFKILARIGQVAYKLELPDSSKIHPVFHVSQLKPFRPDNTAVATDLPVQVQLDTLDVEPEEILERRLCKKGNAAHVQIKVKWSSLPAHQATWEDYDVLRARFPSAPAWGQASSSGGGGVTTGQAQEPEE
jgi:ribosomal protein L21E